MHEEKASQPTSNNNGLRDGCTPPFHPLTLTRASVKVRGEVFVGEGIVDEEVGNTC